jgi:hypothetical protein
VEEGDMLEYGLPDQGGLLGEKRAARCFVVMQQRHHLGVDRRGLEYLLLVLAVDRRAAQERSLAGALAADNVRRATARRGLFVNHVLAVEQLFAAG